MERVRVVRAGLLIGWILVSTLVVAGFAAFSADDGDVSRDADLVTAADVGDLGRNSGAVAGLGFAATAPTSSSTATSIELDPVAESAILDAVRAPTTTVAPTDSGRSGGVFIRSGYLDEIEVRAVVGEFFQPEDVNRAIRVAWCESSFNPAAVNPATGASGLFQHLPEFWADRSEAAGRTGASIFDPEANVAVAAWLLYEVPGGWSHWDCVP